jgi:hypothetical protein
MNDQRVTIYDDKEQVRGHLDLTDAQWRLAAPEGTDAASGDFFEIAFVQHTDGVTYTVMRKVREPEGIVLVYSPQEWAAFLGGAEDGDFDVFIRPKPAGQD